MIAWALGHAIDCATQNDMRKVKEHLVLLLAAIEQSNIDRNDWSLAWMLTLLEEPPAQLFQDRTSTLLHNAKPFSPLVPPQWTAVCLAYLKDLEVLATKRAETGKKQASTKSEASAAADAGEPSPKRKARFPKRPKSKAAPEQ